MHKETKKLWTLTWGCEGKWVFWRYTVFGVWVSIKQNPGPGQIGRQLLRADKRHCACYLFQLRGMRQTGRIASGLTRHLFFFFLTISSPGCLAYSAASIVQFTSLPKFALSSCESSFSAIELIGGHFCPPCLILLTSYNFVLGAFAPVPNLGLCPSLSILGTLHPLSILGAFAPPYSWGANLVYPKSGVWVSILWLWISLCIVNPLV